MTVRLDHSPFRVQIALALAIAMAGVFLVNTLLISVLVGNSMRASAGRQLADLAADMAARLDQGMYERWSNIRVLARLEETLLDQPNVVQRRVTALEELRRSAPEFAWIGFASPQGVVTQATGGMLEQESVLGRPWFQAGQKGMFAGDLHKAVLLQTLLGGEGTEPLRFVDIAAPIRGPDGGVEAVLGAHLSWKWAEQLRELVLNPRRSKNATEILIVDQKGDVILGPHIGQKVGGLPVDLTGAAGQAGYLKGRLAGQEVLLGHAATMGAKDYPGLGWIVVAAQPLALANRTLQQLLIGIVAVGLTTILGGIGLGWLLASRVSSPLGRLTNEAKRIGLEADAMTLPRLTGSLEVVELSQALRSLLRRLGIYARGVKAADARAMTLAEQNAELLERATRDPLTGLLNRRAFFERAATEIAAARRFDEPLGVVMVDIDHFKRINDTLGHAAGDLAIRGLADQLRQNSRETDALARFGGEEFVVLLPRSDEVALSAFAEKLRAAVASARFGSGDGKFAMTISIGCAVLSPQDDTIEATIDRADGGLYAAKNGGRNRIAWG